MARRDFARAVAAIEEHGVLLVYPLANRSEPASLWSVLHPRSPMRWSWTAEADPRISALWDLREELAQTRRVVYGKWLFGRATFFARDVFRAMIATLRRGGDLRRGLPRDSLDLLEVLLEDSPVATKALRARAGFEGKAREAAFARAIRPLWARLLVVGAGEVAEGGFPSLAMGATELLFEDLWRDAVALTGEDGGRLARTRERSPSFARTFDRVRREVGRAASDAES